MGSGRRALGKVCLHPLALQLPAPDVMLAEVQTVHRPCASPAPPAPPLHPLHRSCTSASTIPCTFCTPHLISSRAYEIMDLASRANIKCLSVLDRHFPYLRLLQSGPIIPCPQYSAPVLRRTAQLPASVLESENMSVASLSPCTSVVVVIAL